MRICLVADALPGFHQTWSGAELLSWHLGQMLQREGHDVSFITTRIRQKLDSKLIYQVSTPLCDIRPFFGHFIIDVFTLFSCLNILKRLRPDIVHLHTHNLFLPTLISAKILGIPVVLTVPDYFIICPTNILMKSDGQVCADFHGAQCAQCVRRFELVPVWLRKALFYYRFRLFKYFISRLDALIALSKTSKARLEQCGLPGGKIRVIYHYQPGSKIADNRISTSQAKSPVILFVGSLHEHKGLHIIIEAMSYVINKVPSAQLVVVGTSTVKEYEARIGSMVESLGLRSHIQFTGQRDNEEVLQLIARSNVVVVPEQWPNDFGPMILVEAKALGKAVIASRIGGIPEFINDGVDGFCVTHNQPEEFAQKIIWVLQHKNEAQVIGEKAKQSTAFLYDQSAQNIINVYRSVIELGI